MMRNGPSQGWRLSPEHAATTQGLVVSPFAHLECAEALFLRLPSAAGGGWLARLLAIAPITSAAGPASPSRAIAFTASGLAAIGLDAATLGTFAAPFVEGMHQPDRQRRLSDNPEAGTVIDGGPVWGGDGERKHVVHALLLVYADKPAALKSEIAAIEQRLHEDKVAIAYRRPLSLRFDEKGLAREHFGFADGISQPIPHGEAIDAARSAIDPWHGVLSGEILMGHRNAHGEAAPGPVVKDTGQGPLTTEGAPEGFRNLGFNGTYLVVRELRQDVAAFWQAMNAAAAALGKDDDWVAARVIGRDRDGRLLTTGGVRPDVNGAPDNAFGFIAEDPNGLGCPLGSHVRRANPRDGLARNVKSGPDLLQAANNHRILRRGRKFGPDFAEDPGAERGLLFMCLNTDIVRQFEFVQQTWLLNQAFATLYDETDPLLGPPGRFTIPATPLRHRVPVESFIKFAGGEYFFLPSLPALEHLASIPTPAQ